MNITKNGVLMLAIAEASMLGHTYVGTEHVLLSVCSLLDLTGKSRKLILKEIENFVGRGTPQVLSDRYLTLQAKRALTDSSTIKDLLQILNSDSKFTSAMIIKKVIKSKER